MNPIFLRCIFLGLRTLPMVGAITASQNLCTAASTFIDGVILQQNGGAGPLRSLVKHIVCYPSGIVAAPFRAALKPIVNIGNSPNAASNISNNTVMVVQKLNDGSHRFLTGPEFISFATAVIVKLALWVMTCIFLYHLFDNLFKFVNHYLDLRIRNRSNKNN